MSLLLAPSTKQESVEKIARTQKLLHKNNSCRYCADSVKKRGDELMLSLLVSITDDTKTGPIFEHISLWLVIQSITLKINVGYQISYVD